MSDLSEALKKLKFDNRMVEWNIKQKVMTKEEYNKHLKSLKDVSQFKNETPPENFEEPTSQNDS